MARKSGFFYDTDSICSKEDVEFVDDRPCDELLSDDRPADRKRYHVDDGGDDDIVFDDDDDDAQPTCQQRRCLSLNIHDDDDENDVENEMPMMISR